jgi:glycosyltransferase involved in cell wall biosynthesis
MNSNNRKTVSIVVPVHSEEENILPFYKKTSRVISDVNNYRFEIIFVNDGSRDSSLEQILKLEPIDIKVKVIDLSRNFGKEAALTAGMNLSSGDAIIFIDADLQHPPELIPELIKNWEEGFEVVITVRKTNEDESAVRKFFSRLFYKIMAAISDIELVAKSTDFRLIDRKVALAAKQVTENKRIFRGMIDWLGFKRKFIEFHAARRNAGSPSYNLVKLIYLALDSIVGNSTLPLLLIGQTGILISFIGSLTVLFMMYDRFLGGNKLYFTNLGIIVVANTILLGVFLSALGLLGLYIRKIYSETNGRPLYVIRDIHPLTKND